MEQAVPLRRRRAAMRSAPLVSGTKLPTAWGHRFGSDLQCNLCGARWADHASDPHRCAAAEVAHAPAPEASAVRPEPVRPA
jgi:hypothetical protein